MSRSHVRGHDPRALGSVQHLPGRLQTEAEQSPRQPILAVPADDDWAEITRGELAELVRSVAAGVIAGGIGTGDRVAVMSETRLEWTVADLAILTAGAVTVPVYDTSSAEQCGEILADADARLAFVANAELADRVSTATDVRTVVFDDGGLDELAASANGNDERTVDDRLAALGPDDVATIVYTSGTTGDPKGCVLTHENLAWTTVQTSEHLDEAIRGGGSLLQFLPLAHIFARLIQFVCLDAGLVVGYARSPDDLRDDLRTFRPTLMLGVPRVFEKLIEAARRQATGVRRPLFDFAMSTGQNWARADRPGPLLSGRRMLADLLVYRRLRQALGGRVQYCISGGAPLATDLARLFWAARLPILEGYGLTETTAPATVNTPAEHRIGTVGRPLPGVEIALADGGEIMVKGRNVFRGYHGDEERTDEDFDGEWFRTGDLGELDDDGFLTVLDRKKDLIVTASGKNVAPTPLEERIADHDLVAQAMVVGDQRRFVAALITLDDEQLRAFASKHGLDAALELREHERVRDEVQAAVNRANETVSRSESIREFAILDRQFSADEGELTPTLKLRRPVIEDHFADEIESIYA